MKSKKYKNVRSFQADACNEAVTESVANFCKVGFLCSSRETLGKISSNRKAAVILVHPSTQNNHL